MTGFSYLHWVSGSIISSCGDWKTLLYTPERMKVKKGNEVSPLNETVTSPSLGHCRKSPPLESRKFSLQVSLRASPPIALMICRTRSHLSSGLGHVCNPSTAPSGFTRSWWVCCGLSRALCLEVSCVLTQSPWYLKDQTWGRRTKGLRNPSNRGHPGDLRTDVEEGKINHSSRWAAYDGQFSCFAQTGFRILLCKILWSEICHKSLQAFRSAALCFIHTSWQFLFKWKALCWGWPQPSWSLLSSEGYISQKAGRMMPLPRALSYVHGVRAWEDRKSGNV